MSLHDLKIPALSLILSVLGGIGSALWYTADDRATTRERLSGYGSRLQQVELTLRERQIAVTGLDVVKQQVSALESRMGRCEARLFGIRGGDET